MAWKSPKKAAEYYGVSHRTIWNWIKRGLPSVKIGGNKLIDLERGDEWLRENFASKDKNDMVDKFVDDLMRGK